MFKQYRTLNTVKISAAALRHNLNEYRKLTQLEVCPVLKSNAYGHGLIEVANIMEGEKPAFLVVDSLYEAHEIKKAGIKTPLLVLGYTFPENYKRRLPFHFGVSDLESAETLAQLGLKAHIEVDTGMSRMGFQMEELPRALKAMKEMGLKVEGLFSHLADADNEEDQSFTKLQIEKFQKAIGLTKEAGFNPKWIHLSNSAGALNAKIPEVNMMRLGLGLYGHSPVKIDLKLKPALKLESSIINTKRLKKGDKVSYGCTFEAPQNMHIGIIPFGYYEGLPRALSNKLNFLGRICMNHCMIEVDAHTKIGDKIEIYPNIKEAAKKADTIPYELLTRLASSIRREVI